MFSRGMEGKYKIEHDMSVEPVKLPKRRVPVAMMTALKEQLSELDSRGIIAPVERSRLDQQSSHC